MTQLLVRYSRILEIVGDIVKVHVPEPEEGEVSAIGYGDLALIENILDPDQPPYMAQVIQLDRDSVSLQVFSGTKGLSTKAGVRFLGHPMQVTFSPNIMDAPFPVPDAPLTAVPVCPKKPVSRSTAPRLIRPGVSWHRV